MSEINSLQVAIEAERVTRGSELDRLGILPSQRSSWTKKGGDLHNDVNAGRWENCTEPLLFKRRSEIGGQWVAVGRRGHLQGTTQLCFAEKGAGLQHRGMQGSGR